ncbi:TldD/PmbA family protein [Lutispora saccharofermentans]|uniref:TldD/PmbA family protein n=1 Tax=Lutispora saccharofermentans TaxID=3024236 RepID=A0ABT1NGQ6_9FIRM|nr:TldD/PmbA family protein [Lutispora saccharofermentans]MCQ1530468.1 TldD/PmbA family protein [Lutispora saccharofermentans]
MDISKLQERLFDKGKQIGFGDMEIYYSSGRSTAVKVWNKEIRGYEIREQSGVSFRGLYNNKMGYSYTEKLDDKSADFLLDEAIKNAKSLEINGVEELFGGADHYEKLDNYSEALAELSTEAMIRWAFEMENAALESDSRIKRVIECVVSNTCGETAIINTRGLNCRSKYADAAGGIYVMAGDGKQTATGFESDFTLQDVSKLNFKEIGEKAAREAVSKLGASSIESGNYPVIFRYDTATQLLGAFVSSLSGEAVEKGFSKLEGRLGEQIAGINVTIIEDPLMKNVPGSAAFDGEGYPTRRFELVKEGRLMTFMHNSKTARKAGTLSTGNARKGGYRGTVNVGPHNIYLKPGSLPLEAMIEKTQKGILIVELQGANAGINFVSGNFSLYAIGHLIDDGKLVHPVDQITVSGNIFEILSDIEEIGGDLRIRGAEQ